MKNVIIVNSLENYEKFIFFNKNHKNNDIWTTSEKVLIELKKKNLNIYNLEKIAKQEEINNLGILAFNFQEKISSLIKLDLKSVKKTHCILLENKLIE